MRRTGGRQANEQSCRPAPAGARSFFSKIAPAHFAPSTGGMQAKVGLRYRTPYYACIRIRLGTRVRWFCVLSLKRARRFLQFGLEARARTHAPRFCNLGLSAHADFFVICVWGIRALLFVFGPKLHAFKSAGWRGTGACCDLEFGIEARAREYTGV